MSNVIRVLGIDPSLRNFGMARTTVNVDTLEVVVESVGVIQPVEINKESKKVVRKNSDDLRRGKWLQSEMVKACEGVDVVSVEMPVGSQSARAMASYGIVIGVLASCPVPMIEVTATEVKLAGYGSKCATKKEMILWATSKHPDAGWKTITRGVKQFTNCNEHSSDALASVYAALETQQFKMAMAMTRKALG